MKNLAFSLLALLLIVSCGKLQKTIETTEQMAETTEELGNDSQEMKDHMEQVKDLSIQDVSQTKRAKSFDQVFLHVDTPGKEHTFYKKTYDAAVYFMAQEFGLLKNINGDRDGKIVREELRYEAAEEFLKLISDKIAYIGNRTKVHSMLIALSTKRALPLSVEQNIALGVLAFSVALHRYNMHQNQAEELASITGLEAYEKLTFLDIIIEAFEKKSKFDNNENLDDVNIKELREILRYKEVVYILLNARMNTLATIAGKYLSTLKKEKAEDIDFKSKVLSIIEGDISETDLNDYKTSLDEGLVYTFNQPVVDRAKKSYSVSVLKELLKTIGIIKRFNMPLVLETYHQKVIEKSLEETSKSISTTKSLEVKEANIVLKQISELIK